MIGKFGLAAALAGALMLALPGGASAASLPQAGKTLTSKAADTVTTVSHRKRWKKWRKHKRHVRYGRYYSSRYRHRPHYYTYTPYYYGYPTYYVYRPYRRHYRRHHRPNIGVYISF